MDESDKVEGKIYVALPERSKDGKSTLSWVLNHFSNDSRIVITHVHVPALVIPSMGAKFPASNLSLHQVNAYREEEWERADKHLNEYLHQCSKAKFKAEKIMFVSDDIAHGLVELIGLHNMSYLVMGAASDKRYSRGMADVKSETARIVMEKAHPSCKISFICKGTLVCTREPALEPPQALNQSVLMPMGRNGQIVSPRKSSSSISNLHAGGMMVPRFPPQLPAQTSRRNSDNYSLDFSEGATSSRRTDAASSTASEEGSSNYDLLSLNRDDDFEARSLHELRLESQRSTSARELIFQGNIADICVKLQAALEDTAKYRNELNEEICKREKAEMDLASLMQKAEEATNALLKEKQEVELLYKEEIELVKFQLDILQAENKRLQEENDKALRDVAGHGSYVKFSEFSLLELQQATEDFSESHKIGQGGFGCVYKGFLRNIMVAIKMLNPQSLQGRPEFEQEVAILSTMRHPNLVTLIGTCSEKSALVYEYLPNGSLEDRLLCKGNTPPLTWQVRTRIIGEICRALLFLHSNNPNPIVHGDLKPANILLDANFVSKLSDFGISRLLIGSNTNTLVYRTEYPRGTLAYMDPEFLRSGEITVKSDVYSFGIIVLQLLTGRPPTNIATDVEDAIDTNSLHLLIDELAGEWPFVQAEQLANLGLRCAQMHRRRRPDLESEWKLVESLMEAASLSVLPSLKPQLDDNDIPSYFICPIFQEVMKDPYIASDGYTYEAEAIKGRLDSGNGTSPVTNLPLPHLQLTPNRALRSVIQHWLRQVQHPQ